MCSSKNLDVQGFDSVRFLISRGGITRSVRKSPRRVDWEILTLWTLSVRTPSIRGWRNTVEIVLFETSNSMKPWTSGFHACTSRSRPTIGLLEPNNFDEASIRTLPTSHSMRTLPTSMRISRPGGFLPREVLLRESGASKGIRSVFKFSCLFLRPRPWQFEIWDSTDT